jgi:uncharacterized membrane protein YtjA (UPF0391 family)
MAYWAAAFLAMAFSAAVLRLCGLAALSPLDAGALFLVGVILGLMSLLLNNPDAVPYREDPKQARPAPGQASITTGARTKR